MFCSDLSTVLDYASDPQRGWPPFDPVMTFKILLILAANNLFDERAELEINDRLVTASSGVSIARGQRASR